MRTSCLTRLHGLLCAFLRVGPASAALLVVLRCNLAHALPMRCPMHACLLASRCTAARGTSDPAHRTAPFALCNGRLVRRSSATAKPSTLSLIGVHGRYVKHRAALLSEAALLELWGSCRFAFVSAAKLMSACVDATVPKSVLCVGMAARLMSAETIGTAARMMTTQESLEGMLQLGIDTRCCLPRICHVDRDGTATAVFRSSSSSVARFHDAANAGAI